MCSTAPTQTCIPVSRFTQLGTHPFRKQDSREDAAISINLAKCGRVSEPWLNLGCISTSPGEILKSLCLFFTPDKLNQNLWVWEPGSSIFKRLLRKFLYTAETEHHWSTASNNCSSHEDNFIKSDCSLNIIFRPVLYSFLCMQSTASTWINGKILQIKSLHMNMIQFKG